MMRQSIPASLKLSLVAGFILIGPAIVLATWLAGVTGAAAIIFFSLYFTVLYIVGIKKYL